MRALLLTGRATQGTAVRREGTGVRRERMKDAAIGRRPESAGGHRDAQGAPGGTGAGGDAHEIMRNFKAPEHPKKSVLIRVRLETTKGARGKSLLFPARQRGRMMGCCDQGMALTVGTRLFDDERAGLER